MTTQARYRFLTGSSVTSAELLALLREEQVEISVELREWISSNLDYCTRRSIVAHGKCSEEIFGVIQRLTDELWR